jgi:uncharacterized alpha-E superfamily protein
MSTLNALSAYQMYRQHVGVHVEGPAVVRFLLADPHFPRTVRHCLGEIENCLCDLVNYEAPLNVARHAWRGWKPCASTTSRRKAAREPGPDAEDLAELHTAISRQYFYLHHQSALQEQTVNQ